MSWQNRMAGALHGRLGRLAYVALKFGGVELPRTVVFGPGLALPHGAVGLVVHMHTVMGRDVTLYGGVTIGRGDSYLPGDSRAGNPDPGTCVVIGDDVVVGAGAKILFRSGGGTVRIGNGAVVGANAVVVCDVPAGEIWAGLPARKVGDRPGNWS